MNDGVAVVLFTIFAASAIESGEVSVAAAGSIFVQEVLGGAVLGLIGWMLIHYLMLRSTSYSTGLLITLGAVTSMYATAQHLDVSGPIATVVAGLLSGNITAPRIMKTSARLYEFFGLGWTVYSMLYCSFLSASM